MLLEKFNHFFSIETKMLAFFLNLFYYIILIIFWTDFPSILGFLHFTYLFPDDRRYKCVECNEGFVYKHELDIHRNKHQNIYYKCPECEKQFLVKSNYTKHVQIHSGTQNTLSKLWFSMRVRTKKILFFFFQVKIGEYARYARIRLAGVVP